MLAKPTAGPARISVRCYLCSSKGVQRITRRLHRELFDRAVALPQYAGTKQTVLEAVIRRVLRLDHRANFRVLCILLMQSDFWTGKPESFALSGGFFENEGATDE
jgi:hypothetical protein